MPQKKTAKMSAKMTGITTAFSMPMIPVVPLPTKVAKVMLGARRERLHGRLNSQGDGLGAEQDERAHDRPEEPALGGRNLGLVALGSDEEEADIDEHEDHHHRADAHHELEDGFQ